MAAAAGEEDELGLHPLLSFDIGRLTLDEASDSSSGAPAPGAAASSAPPSAGPATAAAAVHGFDLLVQIVRAANLPAADWWNGLADPYVVARLVAPDGTAVQYR